MQNEQIITNASGMGEVQRTVDTIAGMLPELARNQAFDAVAQAELAKPDVQAILKGEPEHWLIEWTRKEDVSPNYQLKRTVKAWFIGSAQQISRTGTMDDLRALVAALELAERIAEERQP